MHGECEKENLTLRMSTLNLGRVEKIQVKHQNGFSFYINIVFFLKLFNNYVDIFLV